MKKLDQIDKEIIQVIKASGNNIKTTNELSDQLKLDWFELKPRLDKLNNIGITIIVPKDNTVFWRLDDEKIKGITTE